MINNRNDPTAAVGDDYSGMWTDPPFSATNPIHKGLKEMEENLRCYICGDFMTAPVSVDPCQHTFCSLCIQDHASECLKGSSGRSRRKMDCPSCRTEITGTDINRRLTRNPTVENLVKSFQGIRSQLKQALLLMNQGASAATSESTTVTAGGDPQIAAKAVLEEVSTLQQTMANETIGRRKRTRQNYAETSMEDDDEDVDENYNPIESINDKEEVEVLEEPKKKHKQREYRKKLSKRVYSNMKLKDLKDLCKNEGLFDSGTADELKERHERFVTRYNASCDSLEPKSKAAIARKVGEEENERKKARKQQESKAFGQVSFTEAVARLKRNRVQLGETDRVGKSIVAQSGVPWFDKEMNENFTRLIAEARERLNTKPKQATTGESEDNKESPSGTGAEAEDKNNTSDQAPKPSGTPVSSATTATSTTASQNGTISKQPSGTQMAYDPEAVAGISNNSTSFSPNENLNTPTIPKLFQPGCNVPSTISHKQSQESFPGSVSGDPLPGASNMASSSPRATNTVTSEINANLHEPPPSSSTANAQTLPVASSTPTDAEMKARHEAARAYALAEQDTNKTKAKKNNGKKKRVPNNLLEAGVTKTRRVAAPMPAPAPTRRSGRSIVGPWHCQVCTFFNTENTWSTAKCAMCTSERSKQGQGACNEYVQEATVAL